MSKKNPAAVELGRLGGQATSGRKTKAVLENAKKGGRPRTKTATKFHRDGTLTYWSVYEQIWRERVERIPDQELAAMSGPERDRVRRHLP